MVIDSYQNIDLIEGVKLGDGLREYIVRDNTTQKSFRYTKETAYQDAQRKFNDLILGQLYGR